jgi:hypothetical protein
MHTHIAYGLALQLLHAQLYDQTWRAWLRDVPMSWVRA